MSPPAGHPVAGERPSPRRENANDYRRLLATLAARARGRGSRDPESAAQETLKRSLEDVRSQPAVEYYFGQNPVDGFEPPVWALDQLLAWLHAVLHYVVQEERSRVRYRREVSIGAIGADSQDERALDPADPAQDQLDNLIQKELRAIVVDCLPKLDNEYRTVLKMRADGMKYGEIARRLAVSENTVATWVSRGIRQLAQFVRRRSERGGGR